jgi:hypothetical protein
MFMGGNVPLGYEVKDRKLMVDEADAAVVRSIFERFVRIGSATVLARELRAEGVRTKRGKLVDKGYLYKLLNNRTYLGMAVHKGTAHPGEHAAIIEQDLWDKVHAILAENVRTRSANTRAQTPSLLKGLIFGPTYAAMSPTPGAVRVEFDPRFGCTPSLDANSATIALGQQAASSMT